jgi:hypothetical protein
VPALAEAAGLADPHLSFSPARPISTISAAIQCHHRPRARGQTNTCLRTEACNGALIPRLQKTLWYKRCQAQVQAHRNCRPSEPWCRLTVSEMMRYPHHAFSDIITLDVEWRLLLTPRSRSERIDHDCRRDAPGFAPDVTGRRAAYRHACVVQRPHSRSNGLVPRLVCGGARIWPATRVARRSGLTDEDVPGRSLAAREMIRSHGLGDNTFATGLRRDADGLRAAVRYFGRETEIWCICWNLAFSKCTRREGGFIRAGRTPAECSPCSARTAVAARLIRHPPSLMTRSARPAAGGATWYELVELSIETGSSMFRFSRPMRYI